MNLETSSPRRDFLRATALAGGGLVIGFLVPGARRFAMAQEATAAAPTAFVPNAFLSIAADDTITVQLAHAEMGQGIWTTLPMLIAEELDADWSRIRVEHGAADKTYTSPVFGMQGTGGSTTTWSEFDRYRQAGATARAMLLQAAAARLKIPADQLRTENGAVVSGTTRLRYGELANDAGQQTPPALDTLKLRDPKDWKLIGKPTKRLDTPEKITGKARFGMDVQFEGLLTAVVLRSPVFGGTVKSFDATKARAVAGVRNVVQVPSGVAVIADHYWAAKLGRDALQVVWEAGDGAKLDSTALRQQFSQLATEEGPTAVRAPVT